MFRTEAARTATRVNAGKSYSQLLLAVVLGVLVFVGPRETRAEESSAQSSPAPSATPTQPAKIDPKAAQAERESAFAKLLSNATLDGNFTMTGSGQDSTKLMHDKYTLAEVKKLDGNQWLIRTRIQYGDKDFTVPLTLPVEWAGDTPVIIVDNVGLPGLGSVSARVMFFADHYAGFWQHGTRTGHLFGVIRHDADKSATADAESH
jgi:hypothetical protein